MITFNIAQWRAWAPGLETIEDWQQWNSGQATVDIGDTAPDVSFLPAMQRRRLSRLARMAFSVGWPLADGREQLPLVFVSRHGETPRTFEILSELAADQPLSPTQFSLSVHNAVIGLWSIMRGETSEMTALAAAGDGLEHGVIEVGALLAEGAPAVLLIVTEEQPPNAYATWVDDVPFPYAVGLLLTPGTDWQLSLNTCEESLPRMQLPHALNLLRTLLSGHSCCQHSWKNRLWNWQRRP
ncbi:beta-ketoacyl synthase chain length factor [Pseudomonas sp. CCI3.2]|uniref:beta-ketoacyl synthase chain length factor n=1 Tax=unclassified Pseudomonas TaxID=196821 RepID=UPI002AC98D82|nr:MULTISPECIES: beta-ketoacyl synthase chain length factor [unclassified Pseudomonas]MEB0079042.1 beta-ketoacyl synthase chain length factor [Pseudomonas sp. MH10out]MEB0090583.1 beta-ketoacyl synthase chain length factor [Pseudomonas sp. CCI4.2]MEB0102160.1 beta-ketoacyl synthase chain length factor [Pseudomonas sp. CCI3.2]MEB0119939.1 beta-ketoacyl synthase chain length factor [Pseudomonas sp. CCI1.2]MEB0130662.1 beta-ketoacyl synthase chain length factor [Pseudomonas sp. CCI2.4]